MVTLQFVLGRAWTSRTIALFGGGHLSHVDAVLPDGRLLGARWDRTGGAARGVWVRPPFYEKWAKRLVLEIPANKRQTDKFYGFLHAQVGKDYDSTAIWAFIVNRSWRDDDSWMCSELCSAALEHAGVIKSLYYGANKVTPVGLCMIATAIGAMTEDGTYGQPPEAPHADTN